MKMLKTHHYNEASNHFVFFPKVIEININIICTIKYDLLKRVICMEAKE